MHLNEKISYFDVLFACRDCKQSKKAAHLHCGALVRERTIEEGANDVHNAVGHVILERRVNGALGGRHLPHVHEEAALEQAPHVVRRVDLLHFHLSVDVTVIQEVDVRLLHLGLKNK